VQCTLAGEDATQFQADKLTPWVSTLSKSLNETTERPLYRLPAKLVKLSS